jgi:hypothetical protein
MILATASKAKRVTRIIALVLAGLILIFFGWIFLPDTSPTRVGLHSFGEVDVSRWDEGFVSAGGTWQPERKPERILFLTLNKPLNITKIQCEKRSGVCEVATAYLDQPATSGFGYYLDLDLYQIEIKKWTNTTIEFSLGNPSIHCFIENYVISRSTKTITGLSTADGQKCEEPLPAGITRVRDMKPLQLSFVSGSDLALRNWLDKEAPTRTFVSGIVATVAIAWLLFCAIWIVRVIRR